MKFLKKFFESINLCKKMKLDKNSEKPYAVVFCQKPINRRKSANLLPP